MTEQTAIDLAVEESDYLPISVCLYNDQYIVGVSPLKNYTPLDYMQCYYIVTDSSMVGPLTIMQLYEKYKKDLKAFHSKFISSKTLYGR